MDENKTETTLITASKKTNLAEFRLLKKLITYPNLLDNPSLDEDLFVHKIGKILFNALKHLKELNVEPTTQAILQQTLDKSEYINFDLIENSIKGLKSDDSEDINDIIKDLQKATRQIKLKDYFDELSSEIEKSEFDSTLFEEKLSLIVEKFNELETGQLNHVLTYKQWLMDYKEKLKLRKEGKQYSFGCPILDELITKGASPGDIGIIASATGMGKTTFIQYLTTCLGRKDIPLLWLNLEMTSEDVFDRKLSSEKGIPFKNIANPENISEYIAIEKEVDDLLEKATKQEENKENPPFGISSYPNYNLNMLREEIQEFQRKNQLEYCVVLIDLLSMVHEFYEAQRGANLAQTVEIAMNKLSAIAKLTNTHIIGTVQFNRKTDDVKIEDPTDIEKTKPMLGNIKNSQGYSERARYVLGLHRPKYYIDKYLFEDEKAKQVEDICNIYVLKQNNGKTGKVEYKFDVETFTMTPIMREKFVKKEEKGLE
jgi:replicative DNA helicase